MNIPEIIEIIETVAKVYKISEIEIQINDSFIVNTLHVSNLKIENAEKDNVYISFDYRKNTLVSYHCSDNSVIIF